MSSFLVDNQTINRVVTFLRYSESKMDSTWYLRKLKDAGYDLLDGAEDRLGRAMFDLNVRALRERYGEKGEMGYRDMNYQYQFEGTGFTKMQALKSLDCWLYQCSEGDVPEDPFFKIMDGFADSVRKQIVQRMPEYDKAVWG